MSVTTAVDVVVTVAVTSTVGALLAVGMDGLDVGVTVTVRCGTGEGDAVGPAASPDFVEARSHAPTPPSISASTAPTAIAT